MALGDPGGPRLLASHTRRRAADSFYLQGNYAYVAWQEEGLKILDVRDPARIRLAGSFATGPCRTPYLSRCTDVYVTGRHAFLAYDGWLSVLDVRQPNRPVLVGRVNLDTAEPVAMIAGRGRQLYLATLARRIYRLDVSSPSRPVLVSWYDSGYYYAPRTLRLFGDRLYAVATRGLFVLDASDPSRLTLDAWYPGTDAVDVHVANDLVYLTTHHGVTVLRLR